MFQSKHQRCYKLLSLQEALLLTQLLLVIIPVALQISLKNALGPDSIKGFGDSELSWCNTPYLRSQAFEQSLNPEQQIYKVHKECQELAITTPSSLARTCVDLANKAGCVGRKTLKPTCQTCKETLAFGWDLQTGSLPKYKFLDLFLPPVFIFLFLFYSFASETCAGLMLFNVPFATVATKSQQTLLLKQ